MPKAKGHISQLQGDALTVATQLHGQILHALNFVSTLAAWPTGANKHIKEIEILVDEYLERTVVNEKKLEALKQADFAKLISLWYPDAQWPELKVATAYTVLWIFVWDDEVDTGGLADESLAQEYYQNSIAYARYILGLDEHFHTTNGDANVVIPPHTNMTLFVDFGSVLREKTDIQQRQRFFDNLKDFKEQVGVEHSYRISGSMPSLSDYMVIRMGSVGCTPQIALTDFMLRIRLPESVMGCDAMTALWGQTTRICIVLNDLYSAQKEMAQGSLLNIVPIIFHDIKDTGQKCLSMISQELDRILRDAMEKFELAARELEYMAPRRSQLNEDILKFVKWCRYYVMACLHWTLESHRYGMIKCTNADGTLSIPF
ncbi:isoprenoid synthase domain-containing protein [Xylaria bambusicola]|uniref:isoprenoid synthase domain-containing protein n=1 Tax=Xylaria bambusicola TaxID=326684 RepID=UPI00200851DF|nr:isoprenoid synthase domain-containing protein [Xylaria bambusicola]KAI0513126.1 isoprenoid synthase domain-containing protein [Xylaria bambusicola]